MRTLSRTTLRGASGIAVCSLVLVVGPAQLAGAVSVKAGVAAVATTGVNIRSAPSTSARILGGLERGQRVTAVGQTSGAWVKVRFDKTTAYVSGSYLNTTGKNAPAAPTRITTTGSKITTASLNVRSGASLSSSVVGTLSEGTRLTLTGALSGTFAQTVYRGEKRWVSMQYVARLGQVSSSPVITPTPTPTVPVGGAAKGQKAVAFAKSQLGKPYKFGATGPKSYDCSGLVQAAWKSVGVSIPRTTQQQFKAGKRITKSELRAGDLVFFYSSSPSHVAMYVGNGQVIHSPRPGKTVSYIKMSYMPYSGAVRPG